MMYERWTDEQVLARIHTLIETAYRGTDAFALNLRDRQTRALVFEFCRRFRDTSRLFAAPPPPPVVQAPAPEPAPAPEAPKRRRATTASLEDVIP